MSGSVRTETCLGVVCRKSVSCLCLSRTFHSLPHVEHILQSSVAMVQASHYSACRCSLWENTFYNTLLGEREGLLAFLACNMKA